MSQGTATEKAPKAGKIDRFLAACGKKPNLESGESGDAATVPVVKSLSFKTDNLVPKFNAANLQRIVLSGSLIIELRVELTGEMFKQHEKNDLFAIDVKKIADRWFGEDVDEQIRNMIEVLQEVDSTNIPAEQVQRALEINCDAMSKHLSINLQKKIAEYLASNKAIKAQYRRYQVNCVSNVFLNVVTIAAWIGVTAASWGATGPVAVVGIVRCCVGLGVDIYNMAIDAEEVIRDIKLYFNAVGFLMIEIDQDTKNPNAAVAWNTAAELGLGAIAGILNVPIPSVAEIESKMALLENKIKGIHVKRLELGKEMASLRKEIDEYEKKVNENVGDSEADQKTLKKHQDKVAAFRDIRANLEHKSERLFTDIEKDVAVQKDFQQQLDTFKANQKSFSRKSRLVFGFATSVGLSVGSGGSNAEYGICAMNECLSLAAQQIRDL